MKNRGFLVVLLAAAVVVCAYDVTLALRGRGNGWFYWVFALLFAAFAVFALSALLRSPQRRS
jgi:hypothetical protein